MTKHNARARLAGILAILGGLLIIVSGFAIHGFTLTILDWLTVNAPKFLPGSMTPLALIVITILSELIALGGITVIFGGIVILSGHLFSGRLLIALGGGTGLIGFLIAIAYSLLTTGPLALIIHAEYWIGIVIAVIARRLAKA